MEVAVICIVALIASLLTFFSGFGLGTVLTPVFAIFFPVEIAIALTGIVHLLNNFFKLVLVGLNADKTIVVAFGIPAFFSAFVGALVLAKLSDLKPWYSYTIGDKPHVVTPAKLVVAVLLIVFVLVEVFPYWKKINPGKNLLIVGGLLSGFFGGLSGNQGALRSAFLIKGGLSKEAFIATGVAIACIIDVSRLGVYFTSFSELRLYENLTLVVAATVSAFAGSFVGNLLLQKVAMESVQLLVTVMLIVLSISLALGLV